MANTATRTPALGDDEASRKYEEAVALLANSLGERKRLFDPTYLAFAQGILAPTQTGGFGEALGNAAKSVGTAQDAEEKRNQELLQARVTVAGQNVEFQRMKHRDAALGDYLNPPQTALTGPNAPALAGPNAGVLPTPTAEPAPTVGALAQAFPVSPTSPAQVPVQPKVIGAPKGALTAVESNKPPGYEGVEGIPVAPPDKDWMSGRDYIKLNRYDKSKSAGDLIKEAQEINQKRYRDKDAGVLDLASGLYYQYPTGKTETVQIHGYPGTHNIDARTAARLSFYASIDSPEYHALAKRVMEGPRKKSEGTAADGEPSSVRQSTQELAAQQKEAETRAGKLGEKGAEKEAAVEENAVAASSMYGGATRVLKSLKESPNFFGVFARPGVVAAALGVLNEGIRTPNGSISLGDLESAVTKLMPGAKQSDIDNVNKAAAELAEMELIYTRLFLSKQGAVTEGERKIVRAIPGTISSSPEVLRSRMELIKLRTQKDMDVADVYRQWQDKNPGRSYLEFERKSDLYKDIKKNYESDLATMFDTIKAVPTSQRKQEAAPANTPAGAPSDKYIRDAKTGVIRKKREGE